MGGPVAGMQLRHPLGQQAVPGHGIEDPGLGQEQHIEDAGNADQGPQGHHVRGQQFFI